MLVVSASLVIAMGSLVLQSEFPTPPAADTACPRPSEIAYRGESDPLRSDSIPFDSVTFTVGARPVKICYGRPEARGRVMIGGMLPYGQRWAPGHVILFTSGPLFFAGIGLNEVNNSSHVRAHSLQFLAHETEWVVTLEDDPAVRDPDRWAYNMDRVAIRREWTERPVETLTIRADTVADTVQAILIEWERTRLRIPVRARRERSKWGEKLLHCAGPRLDEIPPVGLCYPLPAPPPEAPIGVRGPRGRRRSQARPVQSQANDTLCTRRVAIGGDTIPDTERAISPLDSVTISVSGVPVKFCYGRPMARGRLMIGGLVPYGQYWRTGANEPTVFHTPVPLSVAGIKVPPGWHVLYTKPGEEQWAVVIDDSLNRWGNHFPPEQGPTEVGRGTVRREWTPQPIEVLTIRADRPRGDAGAIVLEWERSRVRIPVGAD